MLAELPSWTGDLTGWMALFLTFCAFVGAVWKVADSVEKRLNDHIADQVAPIKQEFGKNGGGLREAVDVIGAKHDALSDTVVGHIKKEEAEQVERDRAALERFAVVDNKITELGAEIGTISEGVVKVTATLDDHITRDEQRFDLTDQRQALTDRRYDHTEERFDRIDETLNQMKENR